MNKLESRLPQPETAANSNPEEGREHMLDQIDHVQSMVKRQLQTLTQERGRFGRLARFFEEKIKGNRTAETLLDQKMNQLKSWHEKVQRDPTQITGAKRYLELNHANELLAVSDRPVEHHEQLADTIMANAVESGKRITEDEAQRKATQVMREQEDFEARWFAEGDAMNTQAELETAAREENVAAYREKLAATQSTVEDKIAVLKQEERKERVINMEVAAGERMVDPVIAGWFNIGTARTVAAEIEQARLPVTQLYREQVQRGAKSLRAQMKAFEGLLTGRFTPAKFSTIVEKIRAELGPGPAIDHSLHDSAEASFAASRIKEGLQRLKDYSTLRNYGDGDIELYRTSDSGDEISIVIRSEKKVLVVPEHSLREAGVDSWDIERLFPSSAAELAEYVDQRLAA